MPAHIVAAALIALAPAPQAADAAPTRVEIDLSSFKFTPSDVVLEHGRSYVLHIANLAGGGHDLMAPEFFAAARVAAADRKYVEKGEVELDGHDAVDIHIVAPAAGSYKMHCSHFMHSTFGMKGTITVR